MNEKLSAKNHENICNTICFLPVYFRFSKVDKITKKINSATIEMPRDKSMLPLIFPIPIPIHPILNSKHPNVAVIAAYDSFHL